MGEVKIEDEVQSMPMAVQGKLGKEEKAVEGMRDKGGWSCQGFCRSLPTEERPVETITQVKIRCFMRAWG